MPSERAVSGAILEAIRVPPVLANVANTATADLYHGPVYFDAKGNRTGWMDGTRQFDFPRACQIIRRWFDRLPAYYYEPWSGYAFPGPVDGPETDPTELYELDRRTLATALFGPELARHIL